MRTTRRWLCTAIFPLILLAPGLSLADDEVDPSTLWEGTITLDLKLASFVKNECVTKTTNQTGGPNGPTHRSEDRCRNSYFHGNRTLNVFVKDGKVDRIVETGSGSWAVEDKTIISDSVLGPDLDINEQRLDFNFTPKPTGAGVSIDMPDEGGPYKVDLHGKSLIAAAFQTLTRDKPSGIVGPGKAGVQSRSVPDNWKMELKGESADPDKIEGQKPIQGDYPNLQAAVGADPELLGWLLKVKDSFGISFIDPDEGSAQVSVTGELRWDLKKDPNKAGWGGYIGYTVRKNESIKTEHPWEAEGLRTTIYTNEDKIFEHHVDVNFFNGATTGDAQTQLILQAKTVDTAGGTARCPGGQPNTMVSKGFEYKRETGTSTTIMGKSRALVSIITDGGEIKISANTRDIRGKAEVWLRQESSAPLAYPCGDSPENLNSMNHQEVEAGGAEIAAMGKLDPKNPDQSAGTWVSPDGITKVEWSLTKTKPPKTAAEGGN